MSAAPAYHRLYVLLAEQIRDGVHVPGDKLPSENRLAERYGCSRVTVRHALSLLTRDGLVETQKGRGTIVTTAEYEAAERLQGPVSDIVASGLELGARELYWGEAPVPPRVARQLGLDTESTCLLIRRLRLLGGDPVSWSSIYLPTDIGAALNREQAGDRLVLELLEETAYRPAETSHALTATLVDGEAATLLELPTGSPVLRMRGMAWDTQGRAVYFQESLYHSGKYEYVARKTRGVDAGAPEWRPVNN